jgi:hypothetical protein
MYEKAARYVDRFKGEASAISTASAYRLASLLLKGRRARQRDDPGVYSRASVYNITRCVVCYSGA